MFECFAPQMLSDGKGRAAPYARVSFAGVRYPAPYIIVSEASSPKYLAGLMAHHWRVSRPEVIIKVEGGAANFKLPDKLLRAFERGLVNATMTTSACIFTGGTDSGVMKRVSGARSWFSL